MIGSPADFNVKYALDETRLWHFLAETQANELAKLERQSDWKLRILERLDKLIRKYGVPESEWVASFKNELLEVHFPDVVHYMIYTEFACLKVLSDKAPVIREIET